jgi:hypothetical protein
VEQSTRDECVNRVRVAAADKESLQFDLDHADAFLRKEIREGLARGVPASDLAAASGLPLKEIEQIAQAGP